jgi:hypothetical protein
MVMDNVQNHVSYINTQSSQAYRDVFMHETK